MSTSRPRHRSEIVHGTWRGGFAGAGELRDGSQDLSIGAPAEVGGSGVGSNPSSLLVAAANGCYLLTLAAILEQRKFIPHRIEVRTEGFFRDRLPPDLLALVHRVKLSLRSDDSSQSSVLEAILGKAHDACIVTRAMPNVAVSVEDPQIERIREKTT